MQGPCGRCRVGAEQSTWSASEEGAEGGRPQYQREGERRKLASCLSCARLLVLGGSGTTQLLQQSRGSIKMMGMKFVHFYIISEPVHPCHTCDDENREVVQSQRIYLISVIVAAIVHSTSVPCKKILHWANACFVAYEAHATAQPCRPQTAKRSQR